jgi:AcrR family transcriptional regulator
VETRIADTVEEARVAHGPFCSYFDTKVAIFTAVAQQVVADMFLLLSAPVPLGELLETRVQDAIRRNMRAYREMWFP